MNSGLRASFAALLLFCFSAPASANNSWLNPGNRPSIHLELHKVDFTGDSESFEQSTMAIFLSAYVRITANTNFVLEVPFQHSSISSDHFDSYYQDDSESQLGNFYAGLSWSHDGSSPIVEIGARPPIIGDDLSVASGYGVLAAMDRAESFVPKAYSLRVAAGYRYVSVENVIVKTIGGVTTVHSDWYGDETEVFFDYRIEVWADLKKMFFGGAYAGRYLLTDDEDFGERLTGQWMFAGGPKIGQFRPGINVVIPVDEFYGDIVNVVYGVNLSYFFPTR
ncbi:MAG: hypothetical protein WBP29_05225 [Candidatus Zixiibacteriota bacterium]